MDSTQYYYEIKVYDKSFLKTRISNWANIVNTYSPKTLKYMESPGRLCCYDFSKNVPCVWPKINLHLGQLSLRLKNKVITMTKVNAIDMEKTITYFYCGKYKTLNNASELSSNEVRSSLEKVNFVPIPELITASEEELYLV